MTETHSKIRALFLAGLMVLSVFAVTMTFGGTAAAETVNRGAGESWDTTDGSGNIGDGVTIYQGEGDFSYSGTADFPEDFERASGSNEGEPLSIPVPEDQPTGSYEATGAGESLTVQTPRITDSDVYLGSSGETSVEGGTVSADTDTVRVFADYNFRDAEDLDLTVYEGDSDGLDVTNAALASGEDSNQRGPDNANGEVSWELDASNLDSGQYTVEVEGIDDLNWGQASQTMSFNISGTSEAQLNLDQSEVVKGANVQFQIDGATEGDYHVVSVDSSDIDDESDEHAFRAVGDTELVSTNPGTNGHWALVEISGGTGVGSIETAALDDTDVDVTVSEAVTTDDTPDGVAVENWNGTEDDTDIPDDQDDATLTVTEGEISLENPTDFYVPGAEVTVNGTVSEAYNDVSIFARDQGDYERVEINNQDSISVTEGEFEAEDVDLVNDGNGGGNDLLSLPGTYRFAAVAGTANGTDSLTNSELVGYVSDRVSLRVSEAELEAEASIINGQVATGDTIDVTGVASGADDVSMTFFGPRGQVGATSTSVQSSGNFEAENVNVQTPEFPGVVDLSQGTVIMSVGTDGRDGQPGDGQFPDRFTGTTSTISELGGITVDDPQQQMILHVNGLHPSTDGASFTQQQAIDFMAAEAGDDTPSDDQSQVFQFRLTSPRTTVDNVVGESGNNGTVGIGSEMTVEGTTNRQPEDNSITVEAIDGPSSSELDLVSSEEWETDGQWNVTMDTEGLQPGTYTIEADDGQSSDVMEFEMVEGGGTPTDDNQTDTETDTETAEPTETGTDEPTETTAGDDTGGDTDGEDGAGFGLVVALVALVAAALLAVRRNN